MSYVEPAALEAFLGALAPRLRVAVIHGGNKAAPGAVLQPTTNCRPWKSYEHVAAQLARTLEGLGFRHVKLLPDDRHLPARLEAEGIQLAWLNTGGVQGRDPMAHAPAMLELLGIPYVGHDPLNVSRLDNKHVFKRELRALGLPTAPFLAWAPHQGPLDPALVPFPAPYVVKPVSGRGSVMVDVVHDARDLPEAVARVQADTRNAVLVEPFLPGREFCVSVAGPIGCRGGKLYQADGPIAFSALERVLDAGEAIFASLDKRPITTDRARVLGADEADLRAQLHELARRIYTTFDLEFLARVDVRMDAEGRLMVLEANPKPDLNHGAGAVNLTMLGLDDMSYEDLIKALLANRLQRALAGQDLGFPQLQMLEDVVPAAPAVEPQRR